MTQKNHPTTQILANSFQIRRAIVGYQGTGKTTYVKKHILPKIPNKNYFIFTSWSKDYKNIPSHKKYEGVNDGTLVSKKQRRKEIEEIIKTSHSSTVFIFEDFYNNLEHLNWFNKLLLKYDFQFITVSQTIGRLYKKFNHVIDLFYIINKPADRVELIDSPKIYHTGFKVKRKLYNNARQL